MSHSSSSSHTHAATGTIGKLLLGVGAFVGVSAAVTYYLSQPSQDDATGAAAAQRRKGNNNPAALSSSSSSSTSNLPPLHDSFLQRLEKFLKKLESRGDESDLDLDSANEAAVSESSSHSTSALHSRPPLTHSTQKLSRLLRDIRQFAKSESKCKEKQIHVLHRICMAKLLLAFHRSTSMRSRSSSLADLTPLDEANKARQEAEIRKEDCERGWKLLEARQTEADSIALRMKREGLMPQTTNPPKSGEFPLPSLRQQVDCLLLELANELKNKERMWLSLTRLLGVREADPLSSPLASEHQQRPVLIASQTLSSLDRDSLMLAFLVAPILGCWIWTYQLGARLFPNRGSDSVSTSAVSDEAYEDFHAHALEHSDQIDYAVVYDLACQKMIKRCRRDRSLQERLGIEAQMLDNVLPFDEEGNVVDSESYCALPLSATLPSAASASSSSSSTPATWMPLFDAPSLQSLDWCEYEIRAYSQRVENLVTSNPALKKQLYDILSAESGIVHFATSSNSPSSNAGPTTPIAPFSPSGFSSPDSSVVSSPPLPQSAPLRRSIYRQGCLFHMTGLFLQPMPVVGTMLDTHVGAQSLAQLPATPSVKAFSMQGYTHVASGTSEQDYMQYEFYRFSTSASQTNSPQSDSSITSSMVEAHANNPSASQPMLVVPDVSSSMSSAFPSPMHATTAADRQHSASPIQGSTHLFDSASFTSLHMQHFDQSHLSPPDLGTPPLSASQSGADALAELHRYAASLGSRAEVWSGQYRVIQAPSSSSPSASLTGSQVNLNPESARPRVEVSYRLHLVVSRVSPMTI